MHEDRGHPVQRYPGLDGSADCIMPGCDNKTHYVWFEKNSKGQVTATIFECKLCGTTDRWGDKVIDDTPEDFFPIHPSRIIKR